MTTKVRKTLTLPREKEAKMEAQIKKINEASAYLAERRKAYVESAFVAFCGNPNITENCSPKEIAAKAIECADAMIEGLFINPITGKKEEIK